MSIEEQKAAALAANQIATAGVKDLNAAVSGATDEVAAILRVLASKVVDAATKQASVQTAIEAIEIPKPRDVTYYGADPTGQRVANAAIKKAIAAGDGRVPAGTYLIDTVNDLIVLGDDDFLIMDPEAILLAKPNDQPRYYVLQVRGDRVMVKGGKIIGDRLKHTYVDTGTSTRTHEWGYGVSISGNDNVLEGTYIAQCTGDGVGVSGNNNIIRNITSTQNRRQGMSVYTAANLRVIGSEFSMTGAYQTDTAAPNGPCAGVDVEPDKASTVTVTFENCRFNGNRAGFLAWLRSEVGGSLTCNLVNCEMVGNANGVQGKALQGAVVINADGCQLVNNRSSGFRVELACTVNVNNCLFDVAVDRVDFTLNGTDTRTKYDIYVLTGGKANVGTNRYV
jgi:hypothetical protein